jgi:chorismate dehydratase
MTQALVPIRVGAVGYLNARPLVYGLDRCPRFRVRYDVPSTCARLLHEGAIDVGLIPSVEYLRGGPYRVVPDLAIASQGPVASVALFTTKPMGEVRSIAMDPSSRTSVALVRVLCARLFKIHPRFEESRQSLSPAPISGPSAGADLDDLLARADAALVIGDSALFLEGSGDRPVVKVDLGEAWQQLTGLPFVYAFWAGRPEALTPADVRVFQDARDEGVKRPEELAQQYLAGSRERQARGAEYLRDNIKYYLRDEEQAALDLFYRYAAEVGIVERPQPVVFY